MNVAKEKKKKKANAYRKIQTFITFIEQMDSARAQIHKYTR